jgi:hypothetical protein
MPTQDPVRIMKAKAVEYLHNVPDELELLTVTPEQQAIFQYLSAVGSDRFQEFVADVLTLVEGHEVIDITGGPGDEKQDILSKSPDGSRQLTQCKHTVNYATKSTGDELDLMFSTAIRKNCKVALYVTNGDLTPQAKRYINDEEYRRGASIDPALLPQTEYWTGRMIWERIASNSQILNKWFSGAAQVHGLRSVSLSLVISEMPGRAVRESDPEAVLQAFQALGSSFTLTVDSWFASLHNVPGVAGKLPLNSPIPALRAQVTDNGVGLFDVESAVKNAATAVLSSVEDATGWMHLSVSSQSAAFFVHDLGKPIMCEVGEGRSLVKIGDEIEDEFRWSFDPGAGFIRDEDDYLSWTHEATDARWDVVVTQPIRPHEAYAIALRQQQVIQAASEYRFWRLESSQRNLELLQAVSDMESMILRDGDQHLLLALEMPEGEAIAARFEEYCTRNEVPFRVLDEEERAEVLSRIEELPHSHFKLVSQSRELESPIDLTERVVSLRALTNLEGKRPILMEMLLYKMNYEVKWGFDAFMGNDSFTLGSEELQGRLFDYLSIRGDRMLDIGFADDGEMAVVLRRRVTVPERASRIASEMQTEMDQTMSELAGLFREPKSGNPD